jgi:D-serine deaminase-like pyridoxal phosphate-dependent protein
LNVIWSSITRPTLIVDEGRVRRNIARMAAKARKGDVRFRPHFKTHQSAALGEWFRDEGVTSITVSSVTMAAYFADCGWDDITIAFPVNWREIEAINVLAARVRLGLLLDSVESARFAADRLEHAADAWLDADTGYHRTGVDWEDDATAGEIAAALTNSRLTLRGLLTHAGHSYNARTRDEVHAVYGETITRLTHLRERLALAGYRDLALSIGDTPCCSVIEDLSAVDEIRPGNFPYFDIMQVEIRSCSVNDVGAVVACPIVSIYPARQQVVIYGGGVHLSKESIIDHLGRKSFGSIALPTRDGWEILPALSYVCSLSQEHGVLQVDTEVCDRFRIGDLALILPVHSCMSADLLKVGMVIPSGQRFSMMPYL